MIGHARIPGLSVAMVMTVAVVSGDAAQSDAQAQPVASMTCSQLWYARNTIYANKGYCFSTARGRAAFGPGCFPPYGRLNRAEQRRVSNIKRMEGMRGCRAGGLPPLAAPAVPGPTQGWGGASCNDLWYRRNAIFARKGHCFRTARGRAAFGPGCFPPYGRLNRAERRQVNRIIARERRNGCR